LPNKPKVNEEEEETTFEGATREAEKSGLYEGIGEFDLSSAYPSMIANFCLDPVNIVYDSDPIDIIETNPKTDININGIYFNQNNKAMLPLVVKRMLVLKDKIKKEKEENPNDKYLAIKYDAIKGVVNSIFGVTGLKYFRLFNNQVASSITFLVRDLLMYVKEKVEFKGLKVIYWDTDALFINTKEDITDKLNEYIKQWALEKYNKKDISLVFERKGWYTSLFILGSCHYHGYMFGKKDPVIKGIEGKRASSSKYEGGFQLKLLDLIHKKSSKEEIEKWIASEIERFKTLPLEEIAFPAKVGTKEYKNLPIFIRALNNTKNIKKSFSPNKGELFFYIFLNTGNNEVIAFTENDKDFIDKKSIDWDAILKRSILTKIDKVFTALEWTYKNSLQMELF